jgi:Phasin protein
MTMAEVRHEQRTSVNSLAWPMPSMLRGNPLLAVATDVNGKLLENFASAQKEWVDFVHRRVKENLAAPQRLLSCKSLTDVQEAYSQYLLTAFEHYREQSEKVVQTGKSITEGLVQTTEPRMGEIVQQTRH